MIFPTFIKLFFLKFSLFLNSFFINKNNIYFNYFKNFLNQDRIITKCLCSNVNDINFTYKDRFKVNFLTVICKSCGLIIACLSLYNHNGDNFSVVFAALHAELCVWSFGC